MLYKARVGIVTHQSVLTLFFSIKVSIQLKLEK